MFGIFDFFSSKRRAAKKEREIPKRPACCGHSHVLNVEEEQEVIYAPTEGN